MLLQFLINGLIIGSIYAIVSLGFALVYNTTRIFHFAYASLYMIAPYFMFTFFITLSFNLLVSIFIALLLTMVLGVIIEISVYKPLDKKKASHNVMMISSIGVMIILINSVALFYGNETKTINKGVFESINLGNLILTVPQIIQFSISIGLILLFLFFLKKSRFGISARAMRDNVVLCTLFKMNIHFFRLKVFLFSSLLVGIGSILIAWDVGMNPYVGMPMFLNAVVALIVGGIGKFHTPIIGGLILGLLQSIVIWQFSANWQNAVTFTVLLIFLIFRPQGLYGEKFRLV